MDTIRLWTERISALAALAWDEYTHDPLRREAYEGLLIGCGIVAAFAAALWWLL